MTIRIFNIIVSFMASLILLIPFLLVWVLVKVTSPGQSFIGQSVLVKITQYS